MLVRTEVEHEEDRRRIDVAVVHADLRELLRHMVHDALVQISGMDENVGLVNQSQLLTRTGLRASECCDLPLSALPSVDYATIQVQTFYPGASPEAVEREIAKPLEEAVNSVAGVKRITSDTAPPGLLKNGGRINLTIRQVEK